MGSMAGEGQKRTLSCTATPLSRIAEGLDLEDDLLRLKPSHETEVADAFCVIAACSLTSTDL